MTNRPEHNDKENQSPDNAHNQDTSDRWGEPDPQSPGNESGKPDDPHDDWRPFEKSDNKHFQEDGSGKQAERQQNTNYGRSNQHADDRWQEDDDKPAQHHHPRHASERFFREQRKKD